MNATTRNRLLRQADATRSYPTTRKGVDAQLERIAAGKDHHRPTGAHPYRACFTGEAHAHRLNTGSRAFSAYDRSKRYDEAYGPVISCCEYIARATGRRDWAEESA